MPLFCRCSAPGRALRSSRPTLRGRSGSLRLSRQRRSSGDKTTPGRSDFPPATPGGGGGSAVPLPLLLPVSPSGQTRSRKPSNRFRRLWLRLFRQLQVCVVEVLKEPVQISTEFLRGLEVVVLDVGSCFGEERTNPVDAPRHVVFLLQLGEKFSRKIPFS